MAGLDEGVENLGRFSAVLAATNEALQEGTSTLEGHADTVDQLEGSIGDGLDALQDGLDALKDALDGAGAEAAGALDDLAGMAAEVAGERLASVEQKLQEVESDVAQQLQRDGQTLDDAMSRLEEGGFDAVQAAGETAGDETRSAGEGAHEATGAMTASLETLQEGAEELGSDVGEALTDAGEALTDDAGADLEAEATTCASAWGEELPANLTNEADGIAGAVEGLYDGLGSDGDAEGDALIEVVADLAREAAGVLTEEHGDRLEHEAGTVTDEAMPALLAEMQEAAAMLGAAAQMTAALDPLAADLQTSLGVVAQVDELLNALG